jgi:nitrogen fixation/metabolism regulation signal transduction histidine kinase
MVEEFREYARKPPLVFGRVDLNRLVEDVLTLYGWDPTEAPANQTGPVRFEALLESGLPIVRGDTTQLRQVVHNLLANARDALVETTSDGVITVTTETITANIGEHADQPAVRLTVADNGPGFSAQLLQRAFEPYITTKAHGTGLGLAIVRKIVEEHGGYIDISNRRTGGARITILLVPDPSEVDGGAQADDNDETQ